MAKRPCRGPGCRALVAKGYCVTCAPKHSAKARVEANRPSAAKRGYGRAWQKARASFFAGNPLCAGFPKGVHDGRVIAATDLDHRIPHRGDMVVFWDASNWQGLCKECHSRKTATEDSAFAPRSSTAGMHATADRIDDGRGY